MARQGGRGVRIAGPPARRPISSLEKIWAIAVAKLVRLYDMAALHNLADRRIPNLLTARPADQLISREAYMLDQHVDVAVHCGFLN